MYGLFFLERYINVLILKNSGVECHKAILGVDRHWSEIFGASAVFMALSFIFILAKQENNLNLLEFSGLICIAAAAPCSLLNFYPKYLIQSTDRSDEDKIKHIIKKPLAKEYYDKIMKKYGKLSKMDISIIIRI